MALPKERVHVTSDINVTPLVDVMLVLLIIFMVVTPMLSNKVSVTLAPAQNAVRMPNASKTNAITVSVSRDGRVFLGNKIVSPDVLTDQVRSQLKKKLNKTVYVRADARAQYGDVVQVVDAVRAAGVDRLGLITQKVNAQGQILTGN